MAALFQRGEFSAEDAARAASVLAAYGLALPAVVLVRSAVASFYARQDTKTPLWASLTAIAVNVALKLWLTGPYGVTGLAMATAVSQWVNLAILVGLALRRGWTAPGRTLGLTILGVVIACLALTGVALFGQPVANAWCRLCRTGGRSRCSAFSGSPGRRSMAGSSSGCSTCSACACDEA